MLISNIKQPATKAETLACLRSMMPEAHVPKLLYFSVADWNLRRNELIEQISKTFDGKLVVRSSSCNEDSVKASNAGCFMSLLNISSSGEAALRESVDKVIASYDKKNGSSVDDLVLVQEQIEEVLFSGVLFTRAMKTNAPYYIINLSDRGDTDGVTSGRIARMKVVHRLHWAHELEPWNTLLDIVTKIEAIWTRPLDIEFIIDKEKTVHIVQVRPLAANYGVPVRKDDSLSIYLNSMAERFGRYMVSAPHLCGTRTVFSDMADWNPSEIIGDHPNTLAYSLYRHIITDEIWHLARTRMGYFDASPGQLMVSFGKKPYIDVRLSFNSLTPADLSSEFRDKLVSFYLDKLEGNPRLHDKVEHEILLTCYEFNLQNRFNDLRENGFSDVELQKFEASLRNLTVKVIEKSDKFFNKAIVSCRAMKQRRERVEVKLQDKAEPWDYINAASILLSDCRYYGTLPFSAAARMAFIAKQLLTGLDDGMNTGLLRRFYNGLYTVASRFRDDCKSLQQGVLSEDTFFAHYGHLRPSSYDICAPRYDEVRELFLQKQVLGADSVAYAPFRLSTRESDDIDQLLWHHGLPGDHEVLFTFMARAMRYREWLKFEFTRNLSQALCHYAQAGELLGLEREDMGMLRYDDLQRLRNPEISQIDRVASELQAKIKRRKEEHSNTEKILLPPLITSPNDFYHFEVQTGKPNYVGNLCVDGPTCVIFDTTEQVASQVADKIILIENADPGFDWLFNYSIKGLITKYGGATSHMAIRCNELNVPAAIGCGELIYERLTRAGHVRLDCGSNHVESLGT